MVQTGTQLLNVRDQKRRPAKTYVSIPDVGEMMKLESAKLGPVAPNISNLADSLRLGNRRTSSIVIVNLIS